MTTQRNDWLDTRGVHVTTFQDVEATHRLARLEEANGFWSLYLYDCGQLAAEVHGAAPRYASVTEGAQRWAKTGRFFA